MFGMEGAEARALAHARPAAPVPGAGRPERWASRAGCCCVRRGVRRLLGCEATGCRRGDLLRVYRRLEARGEIRGGVSSPALGRAVRAAGCGRRVARGTAQAGRGGLGLGVRRRPPLNLVGILTPGPRLAALTGNRLLYRDGVPVALLAGGEVQLLTPMDAGTEWRARKALLQGAVPAPLICSSRTTSAPLQSARSRQNHRDRRDRGDLSRGHRTQQSRAPSSVIYLDAARNHRVSPGGEIESD